MQSDLGLCCLHMPKDIFLGTHNICFHGEIRKIIILMPLLSRAMKAMEFSPYRVGNKQDFAYQAHIGRFLK